MTAVAQELGRLFDATNVLGDSLAAAPFRQNEIRIIRLVAAFVDVQVSALALDDGFPVLDGVEEVTHLVARLLSGQLDAPPAQFGRELGDNTGALPVVL